MSDISRYQTYEQYRQAVLQEHMATLPHNTRRILTEEEFDATRWGIRSAEVSMEDQIKRLETKLEGHELENSRAITDLTATLRHMTETLSSYTSKFDALQESVNEMKTNLTKYNNLRERMDDLERIAEARMTEFVPRNEFNGAFKSVREFAEGRASTVQGRLAVVMWAMGALFGVIGFIAARVFM
jgi:uncharacterized coiled-coil DUF342 family protein